jgi:hypothetical protein
MASVQDARRPLFSLGRLVATPGALQALQESRELPFSYVQRHVTGDWGVVDEEDSRANDLAVSLYERVLSAYRLKNDAKIWIITEADRSATTILLPAEY